MKCCNNDCNQGRDCPYRTGSDGATVILFGVIMIMIMIIAVVVISTVANQG